MKKFMQRLTAILVSLPLVFTSLGATSSACTNKKETYRVPVGSFVQDYMTRNWSDSRWQQELSAMKKGGMKYLIFSPSVIMDEKNGTVRTIYPSNIPELKKGYDGVDCIDACLRNCQKAGIKVFIALNQSYKFWDFGWKISTTQPDVYTDYWKNNATLSNEIANELYSMYKAKYKDAFYGWYWVHEFWNYTICTNTYEGNCPAASPDNWAQDPSVYTDIIAQQAFNPVLDNLTKLDARMPMMFSNFANQALCKSESNAKFWSEIIKKTKFRPGDIMAPMDSIGGTGVTLDTLDAWTAGYKKAADTNRALHLWSNNETFVNNTAEIALLDRVTQQIKITSKYAENNITFTWNHYYSPYNTLKGFNDTYMNYVKAGTIEKNAPSAVSAASIVVSSAADDQYKIDWKAPYDDTGIAVYNIYKDNSLVSHIYATRQDTTGIDPTLNTFYTVDKTGDYQIEALDFAGNKSPLTTFHVS